MHGVSTSQIADILHFNDKDYQVFRWKLIINSKVFQYFWISHIDSLKLQKHLFADVLQNICSKKFRNTHREVPILESLFNKVAGLMLQNF